MRRLCSLLVFVCALGGCYRSHSGDGVDAPDRDGSIGDARDFRDGTVPRDGNDPPDVAFFDSGFVEMDDAAFVDSGFVFRDSGFVDAGLRDSGFRDAFVVDTGTDAAFVDAFVPDAFAVDSGPPPTSTAIRCTPSSLLLVPDHPRLNFGPAGTLELYVRARGPGIIAIKGISTGHHNFTLRIEGSGASATLVGGWGEGADETVVSVPFGANMGRWTHVALVQEDLADTVRLSLFVDGTSVASATVLDDFGVTMNSLAFRLCMLDGDLDEVRLWRVARSEASIVLDMRRSLAPGIAFMSAYWPLEGSGQIVLDRSLHGAEGVLGTTSDVEAIDPMRIPDGAF